MKYYLFSFTEYYPAGGLNDYVGSYDSLEECLKEANREEITGYKNEIIDRTYMRKIHDLYQIVIVNETTGELEEVHE